MQPFVIHAHFYQPERFTGPRVQTPALRRLGPLHREDLLVAQEPTPA